LFAVRGGHFETTRALLTAGAPANETLPDGTSALHLAVMNAHYELAAFLLDRGADANASGPGWTPLHQLAWTRRPNIGQVNPPPVQTGAMDSLELAKVLFAHGADPNARQAKEPRDGNRNLLKRVGATPFILAAKGCDPDFMRLLVAQGAAPLLTTADGATPLMAAAGVGIYIAGESPGTDAEAVQALKAIVELSGGRHDVNAVDANGDTALHGGTYRGSAAVVQYLVELGGRLDVVNKKGWTPLNIADGVVYNAVFNSYPEAAALIRKLMRERGLPFEEKPSRATNANHGA